MADYGDIAPDETLDVKFTTLGSTGAPTQLAGSPAAAIYPNNSTTEITAGVTLTVDFDGRTGLNHIRIVAATAGLTHGNDYQIVLTAGTVGGVSMNGYVIGSFSCHNRSVHEGIYYGSVTATSTASSVVDSNANTVFAVDMSADGLGCTWLSLVLAGLE